MQRILVIGASGPLGVVLVRECIKREMEVLAVVRPGSARRKDIPVHPLVKVIETDISRIDSLPEKVQGQYDLCIHLAWTHTGDGGREDAILQAENIQNTLKAAKCAKQLGCSSFVGAGSQAEYGPVNRKVDETAEPHPATWYGRTKLAAGQLALAYCKQMDMRCNWVRIFGVYGPYENDYILTSYVIRTLLKGERPILTPCGQIWDYLYCEDAARALLRIGEAAPDSGIYCLGSGDARPLREYVTLIRDAIDPALPLGIGEKEYGANQIMHLEADISKLRRDIGLRPAVSFEEGIRKTIQFYEDRGRRQPG